MARTLYLIDGHAQMFRAYHAIRTTLSSPVTGEPTQAIYGFAVMLLKVLNQYRPDYLAVAIDSPGPTFRDLLYPQYKSTREKAPEDFASQVRRILEMVNLFGIPLLGREGAEADDVIATIALQVEYDQRWADTRLRIVSKDKDLQQLLSDRVEMFDVHTDELLDTAALHAKHGIRPDQVVDMLSLMGDNVDNVPGVDGIGPKTAALLIQQYGSLDAVYENLDAIKGKRRENLEKARPHMSLTKQLVTLKRDVDVQLDPADATPGRIDIDGLRSFFQQMGFRRLDAELDKLARAHGHAGQPAATRRPSTTTPQAAFGGGLFDTIDDHPSSMEHVSAPIHVQAAEDCTYTAVTTRAQLDELIATLAAQKLIAIDTETIGLGADKPLCGLCFAWKPKAGVYVPIRSPDPASHLDEATVLAALRPVLTNPAIGKCGHNIKYDLRVLRSAGVAVRGVVFDSMIAAFLAGLPGRGMDDLSRSLLGHEPIPISALIGPRQAGKGGKRGQQQATMDAVPLEAITAYAAEDADITLRLHDALDPLLDKLEMRELADRVEMPLVEVLAEMEHQGVRVDPDELRRQGDELSARAAELRDQLHDAAGGPFNPDSPKQLAEVLFTRLGLPVGKRTRTGASTDIEVLEALADDIALSEQQRRVPRLMVEYRQLTKLVGTYLVALREAINSRTGRVHAAFHQTGAATGRLSSSGPNLQNIPIRTDLGRQVRKAFVAEPGWLLIGADYSQIELRMLAHLSGDKALTRAFEAGQDIHRSVAAEVFNTPLDLVTTEQRARAKVINFGIVYGVTAYGLARRIEGLDLAAARQLIADYRRRFAGIDAFLETCIAHATNHGYVKTILGRRRAIPEIHSTNPNRRALGERLAINTVVQGSAADLIKLAMVNLHRRIRDEGLPMRLLLQIHDELVVEAPEAEAAAMAAIITDTMRHAMALRVPLEVEPAIGANWLDAK